MANHNDTATKHCIECGHPFAAPSPFCENCGAAAPITCLRCGYLNSNNVQFCVACGTRIENTAAQSFPSPSRYPLQRATTKGGELLTERKLVTIMVVDMIGSLAAIQDSDPEEAHAFISFAISLMKDAIRECSGTVMSTTGDGVLAVFGAPVAQSDHAARACHAALMLCERVKDARKLHPILDIRIGLYSGEVVLGTWTNDFSIDYDATGATVHMASRLQNVAPHGCAVMGPSTRELVGNEFETRSMGEIDVKGLDERIEVFVLDGLRSSSGDWSTDTEPFVGRITELENLASAHELAVGGRGQLFLLKGEAGIGKTRLINRFVASFPERIRVASVKNARHQSGAAFHSFRSILRDLVGPLNPDPEQRREQFLQYADSVAEGDDDIHSALLDLFELRAPGSDQGALNPLIRNDLVNSAVLKCLAQSSDREPLVLIFEDLQNADSVSVDLLGKLIAAIRDQQILVLCAGRPEFQPGWTEADNFKTIDLHGLDQSEVNALLDQIVQNGALGPVLSRIKEWAQGNPLFLRECIRMLADSASNTALAKTQPPASVWAIIAERIDLLDSAAKETLLAASVLGERFSAQTLTSIVEQPATEVVTQLDGLGQLEFVTLDRSGDMANYIFSHPLFQEVCYSTLLKRHRVRLHAAAYSAFEQAQTNGRAQPQEVLAHHAFNGMKWPEAVLHCREAGEKASQHSAPREASVHFGNALHALNRLEEAEIDPAEAIDIRIALRSVLVQILRLHEAEELLRSASDIAEENDDKARLAGILGLLAVHEYLQRGPSGAERMAQKSITLAESAKDDRALVSARICLAQSYYAQGKFPKTIDVIESIVPMISGEVGPSPAGLLVNPMLMCWYWLAISKAELGAFPEAEKLARQMFIEQTPTTMFDAMYAKTALGFVMLTKGDADAAFDVTVEALEIAEAHDLPYLTPVLASQMGLLLSQRGDHTGALYQGRRAVNTSIEIGVFAGRSRWFARLAEIALMAGETDEARKNVAEAISVAENAGELGYLCSALRTRAQLAKLVDSNFNAARDDLARALGIARNLDLKPAFGKCLFDLATIDQLTGDDAGARRKFANAQRRFEQYQMLDWALRSQTEITGLE